MRVARDFVQTSKANFEKFKKEHPDSPIKNLTEFATVIDQFHTYIVEHISETGYMVKLPQGFGPVVVSKYRPKNYNIWKELDYKEVRGYAINWKETKIQGKYIYYTNPETDGWVAHFVWLKDRYGGASIRNKDMWYMKSMRVAKQYIAFHAKQREYMDKYGEYEHKGRTRKS